MELKRSVELTNEHGLHARASTRLAQVAQQYRASIYVAREGAHEEVDAKSILGILTLGVEKGEKLQLRADGDDAEGAIDALVELINDKFGEE